MGQFSPEINADVIVKFDIDDHIVELPFTKLLQLLEINVKNEKLIKVLKELIQQHG